MLSRLAVSNYKSIDAIDLELGRVNLLIGENGSGKSNLLEALALIAGAAAGRLENDHLASRGVRMTDPERMVAGFTRGALSIDFDAVEDRHLRYRGALSHSGRPYGRWVYQVPAMSLQHMNAALLDIAKILGVADSRPHSDARTAREALEKISSVVYRDLPIASFLTYTPHEEALRDLSRESHIEPIGVHGEGLYRLLESLSPDRFALVKEQLALIQWFEDLEFTPGQNPAARSLKIVDQHLGEGLRDFDQRSANEGFLFVLLYACLLISKDTPRFFAVDNVDTALNPKLCAGVVRMFAELTRSQDRQVILTAHNPGALDGLDLRDDEQRLFVVYRNLEGRTRVRRIDASILEGQERPLRLSEAFLRGYLGGLPEHF